MQEDRAQPQSSPLRDLGEGLRFVAEDPFVRSAVLIAGPLNLGFNGILFGIVLVLRSHGLSPGLIGTAETIFGIGGLLGALCASWLIRTWSMATLIRFLCVAGMPLMLAVAPLSGSPLAAAPVALLAFLAPAANAGLFGHLAAVVPDRLQGRVLSALMVAAMGMTSLAPPTAGVLVHRFGATARHASTESPTTSASETRSTVPSPGDRPAHRSGTRARSSSASAARPSSASIARSRRGDRSPARLPNDSPRRTAVSGPRSSWQARATAAHRASRLRRAASSRAAAIPATTQPDSDAAVLMAAARRPTDSRRPTR